VNELSDHGLVDAGPSFDIRRKRCATIQSIFVWPVLPHNDPQKFIAVAAPASIKRSRQGTSMPDIKIERQHTASGGRYTARISGVDGEAELTFTKHGANLISADHTIAPDAMRGTGAAMALVQKLIADARAEGFKIIPVCPYVLAQYKRHPEWADVMSA
jgi:predicted GNAT family acetyltransferase